MNQVTVCSQLLCYIQCPRIRTVDMEHHQHEGTKHEVMIGNKINDKISYERKISKGYDS